jgi:hypothetical protein
MPLRNRKPSKGQRINWTNPDDERVHDNVLVVETSPKLMIRDNYGFLQEIKVKDIDRTPKLPKIEQTP